MSQTLSPSMRRSVLIAALRDPTTWPDRFAWNFERCQTCALGLYMQTFERREAKSLGSEWDALANALGMSERKTMSIFGANAYHPVFGSSVTPAMVADRLETIHRELDADLARNQTERVVGMVFGDGVGL